VVSSFIASAAPDIIVHKWGTHTAPTQQHKLGEYHPIVRNCGWRHREVNLLETLEMTEVPLLVVVTKHHHGKVRREEVVFSSSSKIVLKSLEMLRGEAVKRADQEGAESLRHKGRSPGNRSRQKVIAHIDMDCFYVQVSPSLLIISSPSKVERSMDKSLLGAPCAGRDSSPL
jgi:hypothetical protein